MAVIIKSADLSVSPEDAWVIVERFMQADIRVFSFIEENRIDGAMRTVVSSDGALEQPELNITVDPEARYASYALQPSAFWTGQVHHGSMRVIDTEDGGCRFEWITDVAPDSWKAAFEHDGYIDKLWSELVNVLKTGVEAPLPSTTVGT